VLTEEPHTCSECGLSGPCTDDGVGGLLRPGCWFLDTFSVCYECAWKTGIFKQPLRPIKENESL